MPYSDPVKQRTAKAASARRRRAAANNNDHEETAMAARPPTITDDEGVYGDDRLLDDDDLDLDEDAPLPPWDGRSTKFRLAIPLLRDHRVRVEDEVVEFAASELPQRPGVFNGPEAEHVTDLLRLGHFKGTEAARQRAARQTFRDTELGIFEPDGDGGPALRSLRGFTGRRLQRHLAAHGGTGDPAELVRRERQISRSDAPGAEVGPQHAGTRRHRISSEAGPAPEMHGGAEDRLSADQGGPGAEHRVGAEG